ncbi:MAG: efflux RND transporter periplasmic adaptor subunit [Ferruginibacter sp.]|nr:efflux RND transporter periplasmic adaptor subunit [Ferruginibacter sp.]
MIKKLFFLLLLAPLLAEAHDGEEHGDAKTITAKAMTYFSSEASSQLYELLVKYAPLKPGSPSILKLFVSNYTSNLGVDSASIQVSVSGAPDIKLTVAKTEKGIYEVKGIFPDKKLYNLTVNINSALGPDLLLLTGINVGKELPVNEASISHSIPWYSKGWFIGTAAFLAGLVIMFFALKKTNRKVAAAIFVFLFLIPSAIYNVAVAHGGEDHGEAGAAGGTISNTFMVLKEQQFLFGIETNKIITGNFNQSTKALGTIVASPQGNAVIQSPQTGKLISIKVNPGQSVAAGQVVAIVEQTIDAGTQSSIIAQNSDWKAKRNEVEAQYEAAKIQYNRLKSIEDIAAKKDVTEAKARLQQAEKNRALYQNIPLQKVQSAKYFNLTSPISGVVGNYNYAVGSFINSGETLLEVTNLNKVFVEAQLFTNDVAQLSIVEKITANSNILNDTSSYALKLISTAQSVNGGNQSQKVIFEILNPLSKFKIGENININIYAKGGSKQVVIASNAVTEVNGKPAVFIKDKAEQYSISFISKGSSNEKFTTIIKGVEEGERVVTGNVYQLKSIYLNQ